MTKEKCNYLIAKLNQNIMFCNYYKVDYVPKPLSIEDMSEIIELLKGWKDSQKESELDPFDNGQISEEDMKEISKQETSGGCMNIETGAEE